MSQQNIEGYKRINRAKAKKAYCAGKTLYILPCKTRFNNHWIKPAEVRLSEYTEITTDGFNPIVARNKEFETVVNCYEYYNCNSELGKYAAFFIEV